jgi:hypothetical protein
MSFYYSSLSDKATAPNLLTGEIYTSTQVLYVDSVNGNDSWTGSYNRPYATLGAADAPGRLIVLKRSHAEVLTSAVTLSEGCTVIGEESVAGVPAATLTNNQAAGTMFTLSSVGKVEFRNVLFPVQSQSNSSSRLTWTTDGNSLKDCTFYDDSNDTADTVVAGGAGSALTRCTFTAKGTSTSTLPPKAAVEVAPGATSVRLDQCTFDDSAYGRSNVPGALRGAGPMQAEKLSLLRGSRATNATGGFITLGTSTQGGGVNVSREIAYPQGIVGSAAEDDLLKDPALVDERVYWVDSVNGSDSNDGLYETPYATLAACLSALTLGTVTFAVVVLVDGHTETLSASTAVDQAGTVIVGAGTATLTIEGSAGLAITGAASAVRNVAFVAEATSTPIQVSAIGCQIKGCTFSTAAAATYLVSITGSGDSTSVENCSFATTATTTLPTAGLNIANADGVNVLNCSFDAGTEGFSSSGGALFTSGTTEGLRVEDLTLTSKATAVVDSAAQGYVHIKSADATCSVEAF